MCAQSLCVKNDFDVPQHVPEWTILISHTYCTVIGRKAGLFCQMYASNLRCQWFPAESHRGYKCPPVPVYTV